MALKVFYPTRCELSPELMVEVDHKYRVTVKEHKLNVDPFLQIVEDMKTLKRDDGSPIGMISIECGPTVTGPLYKEHSKNPVDVLFLTRYQGKIDPRAIGPRFSSEKEINAKF